MYIHVYICIYISVYIYIYGPDKLRTSLPATRPSKKLPSAMANAYTGSSCQHQKSTCTIKSQLAPSEVNLHNA